MSTDTKALFRLLPERFRHDFRPLRQEMQVLRSNPRRARPLLVKLFFYVSVFAVYVIRRGGGREVCFHPDIPHAEYMIWKVCALLGVKRCHLAPNAETVYLFDANDEPGRVPNVRPIVDAVPDRTINLRCTDISKSTVSRAFEEAFGYGIEVDPATYRGLIVEKSDANGLHDGRVIQAPVARPSPERVYQRVIDNEHSGGLVEDIRVPVVGASVPFVYLKYRPVETRFSNENNSVVLRERSDVLSDEEIERILSVCARLGLDCGEVDAARDRQTSRLYVLDVNKTCYGPPNHLRLLDCYRATWRFARTFEANFL